MKKFIYVLVLLTMALASHGQQELILTKYTFNSLFFNPAYAGSHGLGEGTAILQHRRQWLDLDGAPRTYIFGLESSLRDDRVGVGFTLGRETIGIESRLDIYGNYAYRIKLDNGSLALGLRTGISMYGTDFSRIIVTDAGDNVYNRPDVNVTVFNTGLGAYYREEKFYIGASIPTLFALGANEGTGLKVRHYYFHTGIVLGSNDSDFSFDPSVLLKYQQAAPIQLTLGCNIWYQEKVAFGAAWRSGDAFALIFELLAKEKYRLSLAYDFTLTDIQKISSGTPEIMLGYNFNYLPPHKKVRNLRHGGRF